VESKFSVIDVLDSLLIGPEDTSKVWDKTLGLVMQLPINESRYKYSSKIVRLEDVAQITMGQSPDSESYNKAREGLPFYQGTADFGPVNPIARNWCTQPKKVAESGDILIAVRAPIGPTNIATEKCAIGRGLAAIRAQSGVDPRYLHLALRASRQYLERLGVGMTFTAIRGDNLRNLPLPLPNMEIQIEMVDQLVRIEEQINGIRSQLKKIHSLRVATLTSGLDSLESKNL
jgi:type I restriction enzyme S subunit